MPQFRLTKKFATDCKIKRLNEPGITTNPLDDWFIDRMIVDHKKIAIITHAKSKFTFFIPYADAGGAKKMMAYFGIQLKELFKQNSLSAFTLEVEKLFAEEPTFTKTVDKKILGHMNDFKYCAQSHFGRTYPIDWDYIAERNNIMPISAGSPDCSYPLELFNALLGINLPRETRNKIFSLTVSG